ncbi:YciI-like protein [Pseudoxanthomonas sp. JBR18]|uniref:YciI-like protein n=1 Tax=Pseudoxanthomonas sp. JBR18 TaxID=2969308 RepID=UPI00230668AD|nr:YciI-like protein [Pseudoxanthomonas sp. JBR18]WCE05780.1 YciI-like protein [Pseudoxanthomonas sp. JBR18]
MHFLLLYQTAPDYLQRRPLHRAAHLAYAQAAVARGELVLGGAVGDPPESALLLFQGEDDSAARRFAEGDPYVVEGVVTGWTVKPWTTVVGPDAAHRVSLD